MRGNEDAATLPPANHAALVATLGEQFHHARRAVQATREHGPVAETSRRPECVLEHLRQAHAVLCLVP